MSWSEPSPTAWRLTGPAIPKPNARPPTGVERALGFGQKAVTSALVIATVGLAAELGRRYVTVRSRRVAWEKEHPEEVKAMQEKWQADKQREQDALEERDRRNAMRLLDELKKRDMALAAEQQASAAAQQEQEESAIPLAVGTRDGSTQPAQ